LSEQKFNQNMCAVLHWRRGRIGLCGEFWKSHRAILPMLATVELNRESISFLEVIIRNCFL